MLDNLAVEVVTLETAAAMVEMELGVQVELNLAAVALVGTLVMVVEEATALGLQTHFIVQLLAPAAVAAVVPMVTTLLAVVVVLVCTVKVLAVLEAQIQELIVVVMAEMAAQVLVVL